MSRIQVSFLGRGFLKPGADDHTELGYRKATYRFKNEHTCTTSFFSDALREYLCPDRLVLLGTSGSIWGALAESLLDLVKEEDGAVLLEVGDELRGLEQKKQVTTEHLAKLRPLLEKYWGLDVHLHLIEDRLEDATQAALLQVMAQEVQAGDKVNLDITHGYRFLPMMSLVAALYLQNIRKAEVEGLYYGAMDMRDENNISPVHELGGLLTMMDWIQALSAYEHSGDFGLFAPLFAAEGVNPKAMEFLQQASYLERTNNPAEARKKLNNFRSQRPALDTPIGGLFEQELEERIYWSRGPARDDWEWQLAEEYLERRDYLRACLMLLEGCITREVRQNPDHEGSRNRASEALRNNHDFRRLNNVRNILAHGERGRNRAARDIVEDEDQLRQLLTDSLQRLR
jgi:CRISPR-associated Csx2 family protein